MCQVGIGGLEATADLRTERDLPTPMCPAGAKGDPVGPTRRMSGGSDTDKLSSGSFGKSQPYKDPRKDVSSRGNSMCKCPEASRPAWGCREGPRQGPDYRGPPGLGLRARPPRAPDSPGHSAVGAGSPWAGSAASPLGRCGCPPGIAPPLAGARPWAAAADGAACGPG